MKHWRIRDGIGVVRIELGFHPHADHEAREESRRLIESLLWRADVRRALEPIYFELRGVPAPTGNYVHATQFERALFDELRAAAASGWLRVAREEASPSGGGGASVRTVTAPGPPPVARHEVQEEPDTWIAIELVDESGDPVPDAPYRIECPDGSVREGTTNGRGRAREDGLYPGSCKVTFPQLHAPDWKKAG